MDLFSSLNRVYLSLSVTNLQSDCGQVTSLLFVSCLQSRKYIFLPSMRDIEELRCIYGEKGKHREAEWKRWKNSSLTIHDCHALIFCKKNKSVLLAVLLVQLLTFSALEPSEG